MSEDAFNELVNYNWTPKQRARLLPPEDRPDWLIVWYPQILLGACLLPIIVFAVLAVLAVIL